MKWYSRVCESFSFCSKCSLFRIWICEQEAVCSQILDVISTHWSDFKNETMISIEGTLALFLRDVRAEWRYNIHKNWASSHLATISNNQKLRWLYFFFVVTLTKWEWVGFEARLRYEYLPTITTLMYVYILFTILWSQLFSPRGSRTKCENIVELWFLWKNPNWTVLRTPLVFSPELMGKVVYYTERKC